MVFFLIVEKVGSEELAVSHIVRSIYMVLMIPLFGFAAATGSLVSNLIGMGAVNQVFLLIRRIIALNLLITTLIIGVNIAIPETILSFFTDNTSLISFAIPVLFVVSGALIFFCVSQIIFSAVNGTGNTATSLIVEISTISVYLSAAWIFAMEYKFSLAIIWCSEYIYFAILGSLSFFYLRYGNWIKKVI